MFLVLSKKKILKITLSLLLIISFLSIVFNFNNVNVSASLQTKKLPIYSVKTDEKKIALTFDAAWGADKTENIMKILKDNNCGGTFFLVGFWIDKYPDLVKKINENGFDIGNHSKNHLNMPKLDYSNMLNEINYVNEKVFELTQNKPKFFRAPFGDYNNELISVVEKNNMLGIQWDVDSLDWKGISGNEILNRIIRRVKNGSIILCHNNSDHILDALPMIILSLKNSGYKMVNLSELVYEKNYVIDNNGTQIKV